MRLWLLKLSILLIGFFAFGTSNAADGISAEVSAGLPTFSIKNPDESFAYYNGTHIQAKVNFPIMGNDFYSFNVHLKYQYLDLQNTTFHTLSETAQMKGPGIGLGVNLYGFFIGYSLSSLRSKHQSFGGGLAKNIDYSVVMSGLHAGYVKKFDTIGLGFLYTMSSGAIDAEKTGLNSDSDILSTTVWLILRFNTNTSTQNFLKAFN